MNQADGVRAPERGRDGGRLVVEGRCRGEPVTSRSPARTADPAPEVADPVGCGRPQAEQMTASRVAASKASTMATVEYGRPVQRPGGSAAAGKV